MECVRPISGSVVGAGAGACAVSTHSAASAAERRFACQHYIGSSSPLPARGLGTTLGFLSANWPSGFGTTHTGTS